MVGMWKLFSASFPGVSGGGERERLRESPLEARKTPIQGHIPTCRLVIFADEGGRHRSEGLSTCKAEIEGDASTVDETIVGTV